MSTHGQLPGFCTLTTAGDGNYPCGNCLDRNRECVTLAGSRPRHKYGSRDNSALIERLARLEAMMDQSSQTGSHNLAIMPLSLPPSDSPARTDTSHTFPGSDPIRRPAPSVISDGRQLSGGFDQTLMAIPTPTATGQSPPLTEMSMMPAEGAGRADLFAPPSSIPQPFGLSCRFTQPLNFSQDPAMGPTDHNTDQIHSQYGDPATDMVNAANSLPSGGEVSCDALVSNALGHPGYMWARS